MKNPKWLDALFDEHRIIRRALNTLLLSASSTYILGERELIEQVLPLYKEFEDVFIGSYHYRKEETLAVLIGLLATNGYRMRKVFTECHIILRDMFKDLIIAYDLGDWERDLASRAAIYYEAMEDHMEDEEKTVFTGFLDAASRAGINDQVIDQMFKEIEESLGGRFRERMLGLVSRMEEKLLDTIQKSNTAAINVANVKLCERHMMVKETIRKIKDSGMSRLVLINDREPVYELLRIEGCFDRSLFRAKQLSEKIWVSMIAFKDGCK